MIQQSHSYAYTQKKTIKWKDTCAPMFIAELFTIAKTWKESKYPWTDEQTYTYIHTHIHTHTHEREIFLAWETIFTSHKKTMHWLLILSSLILSSPSKVQTFKGLKILLDFLVGQPASRRSLPLIPLFSPFCLPKLRNHYWEANLTQACVQESKRDTSSQNGSQRATKETSTLRCAELVWLW